MTLGLPVGVTTAAVEWEALLSKAPEEPTSNADKEDVVGLAARLLPHIRN